MKEKLDKILATPWVAHVLRANARYGNRLGSQFAAAVTYFSILAVVPVLMLSFSALGFTVTFLRPELMDWLTQQIQDKMAGDQAKPLSEAIIDALKNWPGTFGVGALTMLYAGAGWIANLKSAVRAQWRPEFDTKEKKRMIVLETLVNIGILLMLIVVGGVCLSASTLGTTLNGQILHLLHLDAVPGSTLLTWLATFLLAVVSGFGLFLFIYRVFPQIHAPKKEWMIGSLIGAIGLALLQQFSGALLVMFAKNKAAALFGPVLALVLMFNLFAQLTLWVAAWIATTNQPANAREYTKADEPLRDREDVEAVEGHWEAAEEDRKAKEKAKADKKNKKKDDAPADREDSAESAWLRQRRAMAQGPQAPAVPPQPAQGEGAVSQQTAARGVRTGMGAGYAMGAATGIGLGAVIARIVAGLARRR